MIKGPREIFNALRRAGCEVIVDYGSKHVLLHATNPAGKTKTFTISNTVQDLCPKNRRDIERFVMEK